MTRISRLKQRGDTIVEVMIVLAVLGLAIGICYRTATKSLLQVREAQETIRATQLLQSQVELLYSYAPITDPNPLGNYIFRGGTFCLDASNNIKSIPPNPPSTCVQSIYTVTIIDCTKNFILAQCGTGHNSDDTFVLTAVWENVGGQGKDRALLTYRLHP